MIIAPPAELPAVINGMPDATYFSTFPVMSHSGMRTMLEDCPAQWVYDAKNHEEHDTEAKLFGKRFHACVLEPKFFELHYVCLPEGHKGNNKDGQARLADIEAEHREAIRFEDYQMLKAMQKALYEHHIAGPAMSSPGRSELALFWRDPMTNVVNRAKIDRLPDAGRFILDLKTCASASLQALTYAQEEYGYAVQAELYKEGAYSCDLRGPDSVFVFVAQQKKPPFILTVWTPSEDALKLARRQIAKARQLFADCLERDYWPAFAEDIAIIDITARQRREMESNYGR